MKPIRASDIGTYLYCHRTWWYRIHGQESINQTEMISGTELHRKHGRQVMTAGLMRVFGFIFLLVACVMLTAFSLINFLGS